MPRKTFSSAVGFLLGAMAAAAAGGGEVPVRFVEVGSERGIGHLHMVEAMGGGVAAADFDDDGDIDLFVPNTEGAPDQLYRNLGDGTFEEIAAAAGLASIERSRVGVFFDYDGDRRLDLLVAGDCWNRPHGCTEHSTLHLYRQVADGRFEDVTAAAELPGDLITSRTAHRGGIAVGDLDGDGWLDVVLTLWFGHNRVFLNDGDGTFSDAGESTGIGTASGLSWQAAIHDFDRDGRADVYIAVDFNANELWINNGPAGFTDVARNAECDSPWNDMGMTLGDYDNDGDIDLYITNITGPSRHNVLYRNDSTAGALLFSEVSEAVGVDDGGWGWGCTFFDADNDGWLDIAATNGWRDGEGADDPSRFFLNLGGEPVTFAELGQAVGFDDRRWGSGLVAADLDRDGDLDLVQACNGSGPHGSELRLLANEPAHDNHFLVIKPRMRGPNHRAIGAVVRVTAGVRTLTRLITAGTSFLGQEPAEAFFGLGSAVAAERVVIEWPDGRTTEHRDVAADQVILVMQEITGDLDGDGVVGVADLVSLLAAWGPCSEPPKACPADLDDDGSVGLPDLIILFANWG